MTNIDRKRVAPPLELRPPLAAKNLEGCFYGAPVALVLWGTDGRVVDINAAAEELCGRARREVIGRPISSFWPGAPAVLGDDPAGAEHALRRANGEYVPVMVSNATVPQEDGSCRVSVIHDLRDRKRLEVELLQARKLEAVGQLAAGVAHELNTPIQFVSDNLHFIRDALSDLFKCVEAVASVAAASEGDLDSRASDAQRALVANDIDYLRTEAPDAVERSLAGLERVAAIVRALKAFAHPRTGSQAADLNAEVETTLIIARNEYKYVADVTTNLAVELPKVKCNPNQLNQVFLNLIVNAAHAIADAGRGRGTITVSTYKEGDDVVVAIADTGGGIPEGVRDRIFEPFFTTKEVGRGTGQGLALSHHIVVEDHGGRLTFETEVGRGTTFFVRVPIRWKKAPETRF